jgi:hypothetical protein
MAEDEILEIACRYGVSEAQYSRRRNSMPRKVFNVVDGVILADFKHTPVKQTL